MFPTEKILSSGEVVRSGHGVVSHIGIILANYKRELNAKPKTKFPCVATFLGWQ